MLSSVTDKKNLFVVALTQHRVLGNIFVPVIISTIADKIYSITENLHGKRPEEFNLTNVESEILHICNEYFEQTLAKKFAKGQNTKQFIEKMDPSIFEEHVRPYIEKRLMKVADLLAYNQDIHLYFKDKKYNNVYEDNRIAIEPNIATPIFNFTLTNEGLQYYISAQVGERMMSLHSRHAEALSTSPSLIQINSTLYRFANIDSKKLAPFFTKESMLIPSTTVRKYMETFVLNAVKSQKVNANGFDILEPKVAAIPVITLEKGIDGLAALSLKFSYENRDFYAGSKSEPLVSFKADQKRFVFTKYERDFEAEDKTERKLLEAGLVYYAGATYTIPKNQEYDADKSLIKTVEWLNEHSQLLSNAGIQVGQKLDSTPIFLGDCKSLIKGQSEASGFIIKGGVFFGNEFVQIQKIRKCVIKGQKLIELDSGKMAVIPQKWFQQYRQLLVFGRENNGNLMLQKQHFSLVDGLDGIDPKEIETLKRYSEENLKLDNGGIVGITATLRDYQKMGIAWLKYLHLNSFGGCLADDMGLGKTLQTISLIQYCKDNVTYERAPVLKSTAPADLFSSLSAPEETTTTISSQPVSLIVVPTSLVHNWRNEIKKFAPNLKLYEHTGASRAKSPSVFAPYDVVLTTYGTVRNDKDMLSKFEFYYLIVDESQTIKNPDSATYKACTIVKSQHRLSLSGTPIENGLTDLWAQMNFLNKGLLGSLSLFKEQYVLPIEKYGHIGRQEKLKSLIEPFILRRTKEKVAKELPEVTELEILCEMSEQQRSLYEQEKELAQQQMLNEMQQGDAKRTRFVFLQLITKLRQIANHPQLAGYECDDSGKYEEITRNIENVINEGHKVLVFSSFVQHLKLVAQYLEQSKISYNILTGSTTNRQQVVSEFKQQDNNKVFLISLKAGGVGLNLTEADYVFIIDPWWNPAAENQAISRSHRIGQENRVFAYRFITTDSIEERILQLQRQKSELADIFVNTNNPLSKISEEVLMQLF